MHDFRGKNSNKFTGDYICNNNAEDSEDDKYKLQYSSCYIFNGQSISSILSMV